ncbi:MAG: STAS domain-containing protein [Anaerolineae bacterium]|nr:STAS domain-containing protein [Anaerolineae bacterium]
MKLSSRSVADGKVTVLEISGRFDAYEVKPVKEWLNETTNISAPNILINLSHVNFIDSTGLAALVQGMKNCRQRGGNLRLYGLQQPVRIIFELTRLDKAFEIFGQEDEAINAFVN